jgi:hypothetical protein
MSILGNEWVKIAVGVIVVTAIIWHVDFLRQNITGQA